MSRLIVEWIVPIKTVSELNKHEHWRAAYQRHEMQKHIIKLQYRSGGVKIYPPAHIVLTRMSPRKLDSDAIGGALKWVRDGLADCIIPGLQPGRADDESRGLTWQTEQETAKTQGVKIQIYKEDD